MLQASRGEHPTRAGNALGRAVPHALFRTADDRWVAVAVRTDHEWGGLGRAITELSSMHAAARFENREHVMGIVAAWVRSRSAADSITALGAEGVPVALSASASDLSGDPHLRDRRAIRSMVHPVLGELTVVGSPVRFASAPVPRVAKPPPLLGEHDQAVLLEAGLSQLQIADVRVASGAPSHI